MSRIAWIINGGFEALSVDNFTANAGSGGDTFAADDIGGVKHTRVKIEHGADGSATDVSSASPLPVTLANTGANSTAIKTDGSAVTQPVSAASLPLPSGAATAAKQPALGTAGSASADVLTVQGIASMTALKVDGSAVTQPVSAASLPLPSGAATESTLSTMSGKLATAKTSDYDTGAGTDTVQMLGIALPASGGAVAGGTGTNPVRIDPTGTTTQPVSLASVPSHDVTNAGTFAVQASGNVASGASDSGNPVKVGGKYNSTPITVTNGQRADLQTDANGYLKVNVAAGGASGGTSSSFGSAFPSTGTAIGAKDSSGTNMAALNLDASGYLKVNVAAGGGSGGTALSDKAAFTEGSTSFTPVGGVYNETISADPTEDQAVAARVTAKRAIHVNLRDSSGNELTSGAQYAEDSVHASGDMVTMAGVVRKDTAAQVAGTDGDVSCLVNDALGRLHVNVGALPSGTVAGGSSLPAGTNNIGDVDVLTVPTDPFGANADAASATGSISAKLRFIASTGIPITGTVTVGSHAVTNVGTFAVQAAQSGTWTVQPGNTQNTTAWLVTDIPATSGGWTPSVLLSAATTNATSLKGSAGQLGGWYLYNANAAVRYLKFYNKATSPTVGTDTPVLVIPIPPGSAANVEFGKGIAFGTGIAYAITTGVANSDTGAVAANEIVVNLLYK